MLTCPAKAAYEAAGGDPDTGKYSQPISCKSTVSQVQVKTKSKSQAQTQVQHKSKSQTQTQVEHKSKSQAQVKHKSKSPSRLIFDELESRQIQVDHVARKVHHTARNMCQVN